MAINIDTLVHNEFGRSATDQLEKIIGKPREQVQSSVDRAITEVLDGFSLVAREEAGRQSLYEAARYCDDGLIDDPAVFFAAKDKRAVIAENNDALGTLVGTARRDSISAQVRSATGLSAEDADAVTGYVTPGILGVMKRQMLNGAVLDNSDGIGQMLLGEVTTASVGGAAASVDHSVPKTASRQTHTTPAHTTQPHTQAAHASHMSSGSSASGGAVAAASHDDGSDMSWLFRWMLPALLLGGLVLAGVQNCGVQTTPVAAVDTSAEQLMAAQGEVDGLKGQLTALTAERDEALSDRETAVTEIDRLKGELDNASAAEPDTSALDAANDEIASLKAELAKPADTSELDAANAEIASLKEELAKPADTSAIDAANAEIVGLKSQLANVPAPVDNSAEVMSLQKSADESSLKIAQLESELGTVRESRDELEASMAKTDAEHTNALARTVELKDRLLNVAGAKNRMELQLGGLQQSVADGDAANAEKQSAIDDLKAQLDAGTAEQQKLEAEVASLTSELELVRSKRDELTESVAGLTAERDEALGELEQGTAKIAELESNISAAGDALVQEQQAAATVVSERDAALSRVDVLQANLGRAIDDASAKRKAAVSAQSEVLSLQKSVAENDARLAKVTKGRSAAITTVKDLVGKLRAAEGTHAEEVASLQAAVKKEESRLARMTWARTWAMDNFRETEAELAKATKGRSAAITTVKDLVGKLRAAQSERDELAGNFSAAEEDLAKVTKGRDAAISTVKDLSGKLRTAQSERDALAGDKEGLEQSIADAEAAIQAEKDRVAGVSSSLADELTAAGLGNVTVQPVEDSQAVGITMGSSDLYRVGSANLSPQGIELLDSVGSIVSNYDDWKIDVEGHTDGQGIGAVLRETYASNWELSVARAAAAVRYLETTTGIPAEKLSVRGFGQYKPVDTNETAEGREANRRIELILRK